MEEERKVMELLGVRKVVGTPLGLSWEHKCMW